MKAFPRYHLATYPDGGLRTSAEDLGKYIIAMISGAAGQAGILSPRSYREMFTAQLSATAPPEGINLGNRNKGVFWNLYTNGYIGHDGDDPGVCTFLCFNPRTGTGYAFLTNIFAGNEMLQEQIRSVQSILKDFCDAIGRQY